MASEDKRIRIQADTNQLNTLRQSTTGLLRELSAASKEFNRIVDEGINKIKQQISLLKIRNQLLAGGGDTGVGDIEGVASGGSGGGGGTGSMVAGAGRMLSKGGGGALRAGSMAAGAAGGPVGLAIAAAVTLAGKLIGDTVGKIFGVGKKAFSLSAETAAASLPFSQATGANVSSIVGNLGQYEDAAKSLGFKTSEYLQYKGQYLLGTRGNDRDANYNLGISRRYGIDAGSLSEMAGVLAYGGNSGSTRNILERIYGTLYATYQDSTVARRQLNENFDIVKSVGREIVDKTGEVDSTRLMGLFTTLRGYGFEGPRLSGVLSSLTDLSGAVDDPVALGVMMQQVGRKNPALFGKTDVELSAILKQGLRFADVTSFGLSQQDFIDMLSRVQSYYGGPNSSAYQTFFSRMLGKSPDELMARDQRGNWRYLPGMDIKELYGDPVLRRTLEEQGITSNSQDLLLTIKNSLETLAGAFTERPKLMSDIANGVETVAKELVPKVISFIENLDFLVNYAKNPAKAAGVDNGFAQFLLNSMGMTPSVFGLTTQALMYKRAKTNFVEK